jgi:phage shock protein C
MNDGANTPGPRRLYKSREDRLLFGVCAGLADYFGFDVTITRVVAILALIVFPPSTLIGYIVLAILLPKSPRRTAYPRDEDADRLQRSVRAAPHATLDQIRHRFREIDGRIQRLEKYLTSNRFKLDREFEALRD